MALCRSLVCAFALIACESSEDEDDAPLDCDAAIVPLLELEDHDNAYADAWRSGDAIAFLIRKDHGGARPRRILVLDECGAEPRTIFEHVSAVLAWDGSGPLRARLLAASPGAGDELWVSDPFGGRPNARLPEGFVWSGQLHSDDLLVHRGDELFLLPYDADGLGAPVPFTPAPPSKRRCQLDVDGVSYWLTDERQIVADVLAAGTSAVVFDNVDGCTHTSDQAVMLLSRDSGGVQREWAWEPATGRVVDRTETTRADTRGVLLEPQLRMLWLPEDWTTNWMDFALATAPDGTAFIAADGNLYRVAHDETEPFWIADVGVGVSIEFSEGAFYITKRSQVSHAYKLYRVELDGTGFTDIFGQFVSDAVRLTEDRWAFTGERGLYLLDARLGGRQLFWPNPSGDIAPLNRPADAPRDELLFGGADADGRKKTIYLMRPDRLE